MKKLLVKYGRHFWLFSLSVTFYTIYDYLLNNGDLGSIVMLSFITYLFFIDRNGKPEERKVFDKSDLEYKDSDNT